METATMIRFDRRIRFRMSFFYPKRRPAAQNKNLGSPSIPVNPIICSPEAHRTIFRERLEEMPCHREMIWITMRSFHRVNS
jgi:hypothetical protein